MKAKWLAGMMGVLSLVLIWAVSAARDTTAPKEEGVFKSKDLVFESDAKKVKDKGIKAMREKRMRERAPLTEEERKKRQQESTSKKFQGMIEQQEALVARWMKIRSLAQEERAVLTIREIDKLITEQREQIQATRQRMQDALHPEQARLRRQAEKKRLMEEKRAKHESEREYNKRDKEAKRDYGDEDLKGDKKEKKQKEKY